MCIIILDREDTITEAVVFWNSQKIEKMPLYLRSRLLKVIYHFNVKIIQKTITMDVYVYILNIVIL